MVSFIIIVYIAKISQYRRHTIHLFASTTFPNQFAAQVVIEVGVAFDAEHTIESLPSNTCNALVQLLREEAKEVEGPSDETTSFAGEV